MKFVCVDCSIASALSGSPKVKTMNLILALIHQLKGHKVTKAWQAERDFWTHWCGPTIEVRENGLYQKVKKEELKLK